MPASDFDVLANSEQNNAPLSASSVTFSGVLDFFFELTGSSQAFDAGLRTLHNAPHSTMRIFYGIYSELLTIFILKRFTSRDQKTFPIQLSKVICFTIIGGRIDLKRQNREATSTSKVWILGHG